MNRFTLRNVTAADLEGITSLFRETILSVNTRDYNADQVNAWSEGADNKERWLKKIREQYFICCENRNKIAWFASIEKNGYLDFLYIHKRFQGMGLASLLVTDLETYAFKNNIRLINSDVSITAKKFFRQRGYKIMQEQKVEINGVDLTNFRMEKII